MDYSILIPDHMGYFLDGFRKTTYPTCFEDYCRITSPVFAGMDDADAAAQALVDWLDAHPGRFFRGRRMADRQMLMLQYTAPAAIRAGRRDFALALSKVWCSRHPGYSFRVGSYEELYGGFHQTIMGFQIRKED